MGREYDIFGDNMDYGYPINRDEPVERPGRDEFKIEWPPGYWEEYVRLQAEARVLTRDPSASLVMLLNGRFRVRTTGVVAQPRGYMFEYVYGPEMEERLAAWAAFIDSITTKPVKALKELAGKSLKINMSKVRRA